MAGPEMKAAAAPAAATRQPTEFEALLQTEVRARTAAEKKDVEEAVRAIARRALAGGAFVPDRIVRSLQDLIAAIDAKLTAQINEILHAPKFQQLEGAWRGLRFLLDRSETGADLKIRVMSVRKDELALDLAKHEGETTWTNSALFREIFDGAYGVLGGQPYACIVGDYAFDHTPPDVALLGQIGKVAAAAHAPFLAAAGPGLLGLDDWSEFAGKTESLEARMTTAPYAEWRSLRESEDARYVGLTMPRFLARRAYGPNNPVDAFAFEEETGGSDATKFCWANSAYAMASNITRAYARSGWCAEIRGVESGGLVERLPTHVFKSEGGGWAEQCPTEIAITKRRENELSKIGLIPFCHEQNSDKAAFIGAQSLHRPAAYDDSPEGRAATSNAMLGARLPYMFACSRFAHFLQHMVYNKIGAFMEADDMQRWLNNWIVQYVTDDREPEVRRRRPLGAARVVVEEDPENPGFYDAKFFLRPHYQLEGANISLRLVSKLPAAKA